MASQIYAPVHPEQLVVVIALGIILLFILINKRGNRKESAPTVTASLEAESIPIISNQNPLAPTFERILDELEGVPPGKVYTTTLSCDEVDEEGFRELIININWETGFFALGKVIEAEKGKPKHFQIEISK